jgi:Na+-transporting NADH:ubiquinone oxidoreductase subunit A
MDFKIKKGLDLPITGQPKEELDLSKKTKSVAVVGFDYIGMKPSMEVKEGDTVKVGQKLFECKKNDGLIFTAPAAGKVTQINRGQKRVFQSLVIELSESQDSVSFSNHKSGGASSYTNEEVRALLVESGEWKHLRQRPFEKVADVGGEASSVFVTAIDTNPLAPNPAFIIKQFEKEFKEGLIALSKLPKGKTYLCIEKGADIEAKSLSEVETVTFSGVHPAGNPGTHIHFIDPVNLMKKVWHIGYQDVIAIGHLILTGELMTDKVISLAGPIAKNPRYLKVKRGANLSDLVHGEIKDGFTPRVISGSVFNGRKSDQGPFDFLGNYSNQVSLIEEDTKRELLGWHSPGFNKFSIKGIYVSALNPKKKFDFTSTTNGSKRAMVPIESFEKVMPLDILPTQLLRALEARDTDSAIDLGALELAEEDLALCTFAAPGKVDFPRVLRENLTEIEREG